VGPNNYRRNFDGFLTYTKFAGLPAPHNYLQIYRNGIIEAVDVYSLTSTMGQPEKKLLPLYEKTLTDSITRIFTYLRQIGVSLPVLIFISIVGVKGYTFDLGRRDIDDIENYLIDRDIILYPDILVDDYTIDSKELLRPFFYSVWNAAGWEKSINYNPQGNWSRTED
jgi:hypothetical protein